MSEDIKCHGSLITFVAVQHILKLCQMLSQPHPDGIEVQNVLSVSSEIP